MSITDKIYTDETAARKHLEKLLWPNGPVCPHCKATNEATALKGKSTRPGVYWCNACQKPFSVTVGTVYERSHIPLHKWLLATHLLTSSKKGISAHQLMRMLDLGSYRSAWFMAHRIRAAMAPAPGSEPPLGGPGKVVEADEAYIGKKDGPKGRKAPGAGGAGHKRTVLSLVERGGKIRSFKLGGPNAAEIKAKIHTNVDPASVLHTDGSQVYKGYLRVSDRESVDHKSEYVRDGKAGKVHTNTLEGFFSVFKRGMVGTYQHCGEQHLERYLAEFDFRANHRKALGYDDAARAAIATKGIAGKRLTYRRTDAA
jgi:transposase-like protein